MKVDTELEIYESLCHKVPAEKIRKGTIFYSLNSVILLFIILMRQKNA